MPNRPFKSIVPIDEAPDSKVESDEFTDDTLNKLADVKLRGADPDKSLELIGKLVNETAGASKTKMEQIKIMDKLLNTGRAVFETKLKTEEAELMGERLEAMEQKLSRLFETLRGDDL